MRYLLLPITIFFGLFATIIGSIIHREIKIKKIIQGARSLLTLETEIALTAHNNKSNSPIVPKRSTNTRIFKDTQHLIFQIETETQNLQHRSHMKNFMAVLELIDSLNFTHLNKLTTIQDKGDYKTNLKLKNFPNFPLLKITLENTHNGEKFYRYFPNINTNSGFDELSTRNTTTLKKSTFNFFIMKNNQKNSDINIWKIQDVLPPGEYNIKVEFNNPKFKTTKTLQTNKWKLKIQVLIN
jgi:YbbR domain-containing protein